MKTNYLLNIVSEDKAGLVSIITNQLNRKGIEMESIHTARTDVQDQVIITIQLVAEADEVKMASLKIKNIIEVYNVESCLMKDAWYQKVATFILDKNAYNSNVHCKILKYGAVIAGYVDDCIIIQKIGKDEDILVLHNLLEGEHLRAFSKSGAFSQKITEMTLNSSLLRL